MLKLRHLHLPARDPEGLARWYAETFGLEQRRNFAIGEEALLVFAHGAPLGNDLVHFGFRADSPAEVEAWAARFEAEIETAPGYAGCRTRDPEGNCIEIYWD
ncbi:MAG: VOC family protein [Alphaproteobacteria bacterium]